MPSTLKDIALHTFWRPRLSGKHCKILRKNDKGQIVTLGSFNVILCYISDNTNVTVSNQVLLAEYKLDTNVGTLIVAATNATKNAVAPAAYDLGAYTVGSAWICHYHGISIVKDNPLVIMSHTAEYIRYEYINDRGPTYEKPTNFFKLHVAPYGKAKVTDVVSVQTVSKVDLPKNACQHKHTAWYCDIEACTDCGDTVGKISVNNPYNVDPDLKCVPAEVTAFMSRYGKV